MQSIYIYPGHAAGHPSFINRRQNDDLSIHTHAMSIIINGTAQQTFPALAQNVINPIFTMIRGTETTYFDSCELFTLCRVVLIIRKVYRV